jgi:hypothetical protein
MGVLLEVLICVYNEAFPLQTMHSEKRIGRMVKRDVVED